MSGTIMPIFILGRDHAKIFFWQPKCQTFVLAAKTTFGSWHAGTRRIHTGFKIFGSERHLWQNSAKNKSWHDLCQKQKLANTIFFSVFFTYTLSLTL